jgi:predicted signal transduction protein with EAL and GGDEF domain
MILLKGTNDENSIAVICENILSEFKDPINVDGSSIHTSLSIGISKYPFDGEDTNTLMKRADIAMYRTKANGKNSYAFFDNVMSEELRRRVEIERNLRCANFDEEFQVYYQPQINIDSNELLGLEALLRWTNKKLGSISPAEFIPIAEEIGLIETIGEWGIHFNSPCRAAPC